MKYRFLAASLLVGSILAPLSGQDCASHPDVAPLLAFYTSLDGPNWNIQEGWAEAASGADDCAPCDWAHVDCTENGRVRELSFYGERLRGQLPDVFDQLDSLRIFRAVNTRVLAAPLPPSLLANNRLEELELGNAGLGNSLPAELPGWRGLRQLRLNTCRLEGPLPPNIFSLPRLEDLSLFGNSLNAELPDPLVVGPHLRYVSLNNSGLVGCLPSNLAEVLERVEGFSLFGNDQLPWRGSLGPYRAGEEQIGAPCIDPETRNQAVIGQDCSCRSVRNCLDDFQARPLLEFYADTEGGNWTNNQGWAEAAAGGDCDPCQWYGVRCEGGVIKSVRLDDNNLSGDIDADFYRIAGLDTISLSRNTLRGTVFANSDVFRSLRYLDLSGNRLRGEVPDLRGSFGSIDYLDLSDNQLRGCLPDSYREACARTDLIIDLSGNTELPFRGDYDAFCAAEEQDEVPCQIQGLDGFLDNSCRCVPRPTHPFAIGGRVRTRAGVPVSGVNIIIFSGTFNDQHRASATTDALGNFSIPAQSYKSMPYIRNAPSTPNEVIGSGISIIDLLMIRAHILGIRPLASPYEYLAADVNVDGEVDIQDLVRLTGVILGIRGMSLGLDGFFNLVSEYADPEAIFPYANQVASLRIPVPEDDSTHVEIDYIKTGDVNFDWQDIR